MRHIERVNGLFSGEIERPIPFAPVEGLRDIWRRWSEPYLETKRHFTIDLGDDEYQLVEGDFTFNPEPISGLIGVKQTALFDRWQDQALTSRFVITNQIQDRPWTFDGFDFNHHGEIFAPKPRKESVTKLYQAVDVLEGLVSYCPTTPVVITTP